MWNRGLRTLPLHTIRPWLSVQPFKQLDVPKGLQTAVLRGNLDFIFKCRPCGIFNPNRRSNLDSKKMGNRLLRTAGTNARDFLACYWIVWLLVIQWKRDRVCIRHNENLAEMEIPCPSLFRPGSRKRRWWNRAPSAMHPTSPLKIIPLAFLRLKPFIKQGMVNTTNVEQVQDKWKWPQQTGNGCCRVSCNCLSALPCPKQREQKGLVRAWLKLCPRWLTWRRFGRKRPCSINGGSIPCM